MKTASTQPTFVFLLSSGTWPWNCVTFLRLGRPPQLTSCRNSLTVGAEVCFHGDVKTGYLDNLPLCSQRGG